MKSSLKFNELVDKVENTAMTSLYTGRYEHWFYLGNR